MLLDWKTAHFSTNCMREEFVNISSSSDLQQNPTIPVKDQILRFAVDFWTPAFAGVITPLV